ncbi:MAG TPA: M48 family metalloprotease [Thermoanaerobaculia bacterium]|nr:M48 family metalloprotease [Thermoanaerobaculia bacterium]
MDVARNRPVSARFLPAIILALAVLPCSCATNPVTGKSQFMFVSEQEEVAQGQQLYPSATQMSEGATPHKEIQDLVTAVGNKMARSSERPNLPWEFNVVDANEPNAYALPGGKISFTRGLLARLDSEDEVAAVLGHEIGHVTARHSAAAQSRETLMGAALGVGGAVLGATGTTGAGAITAAGQLGASLLTTRYSRDQERQADELGMRYMTAAGYNPRGFVQVMEVLLAASQKEPSKWEALFASHPMTSERVATAKERLASTYAKYQDRPMTTAAFARAVAPIKAEVPAFALADEGKKLVAAKQLAPASEKFERAVKMAPDSPILNALWADTLFDLGNYPRAEEASSRAPGLYIGRAVNGASNWRLRRYPQAIASLDEADKLVPGTLLVSYVRGRAYEDSGDRRAAAGEYAKVAQGTKGQGEAGGYAVQKLREWGYAQ